MELGCCGVHWVLLVQLTLGCRRGFFQGAWVRWATVRWRRDTVEWATTGQFQGSRRGGRRGWRTGMQVRWACSCQTGTECVRQAVQELMAHVVQVCVSLTHQHLCMEFCRLPVHPARQSVARAVVGLRDGAQRRRRGAVRLVGPGGRAAVRRAVRAQLPAGVLPGRSVPCHGAGAGEVGCRVAAGQRGGERAMEKR